MKKLCIAPKDVQIIQKEIDQLWLVLEGVLEILDALVVYHLEKIPGNFGANFHRVKNVCHLTQVRSLSSDCDFTRQNVKMWP